MSTSKIGNLLVGVGQMLPDVLAHRESLDPLAPEDRLHSCVRGEVLLVLRVLEVFLLQVSPEPLDDLGSGDLLSLVSADDGGELLGHVEFHVDASLLDGRWHNKRLSVI